MKIGISTCSTPCTPALFETYRQNGVDVIEISPAQDAFDTLDFKQIGTLSREYGVGLWSFHLPFLPFSRFEPSVRELAPATVKYFGELVARAADIGIGTVVIHASGETIFEDERAERMACAKDSLAALAEIASRHGTRIAVESLPRTCLGRDSSDILALLSAHEDLRCCFDTNHLLFEDPVDFVRAVGNRIVTTHVSDYDRLNERHWLPGEGVVDWHALYAALCEVGYEGPWLYELGFRGGDELIERERPLCCADFVRNAHEIFEGKPLTVIGKPIPENLVSWTVRYEQKLREREAQKNAAK